MRSARKDQALDRLNGPVCRQAIQGSPNTAIGCFRFLFILSFHFLPAHTTPAELPAWRTAVALRSTNLPIV
jgi:hypothetical protein